MKTLRTPPEHTQDYVPEILDKVETVRYLDGTRCRFPDSIGLLATASSAIYLHAGVLCEPPSERFRPPIEQYVHKSVASRSTTLMPQHLLRLKEKSSTRKIRGVVASPTLRERICSS